MQHSLPFGTNDLDKLLIKYYNLSSVTNLTDIPGYKLSRVIVDATWAVILALNHSVQSLAEKGWSLEKSVNHSRVNQGISKIIRQSLNQVKFFGLSVSWLNFYILIVIFHMCIKGIVDFSYKNSSDDRNRFMTSDTFDTARVSQIISNNFYIPCITIKMSCMNFTDKSSCTVEIYKATNEMKLNAYSGSCNYTWGNGKSKHTATQMCLYQLCISLIYPPTILTDNSELPYPKLPDSWLIFTIVFLVNFIVISIVLVMCNVALRNNKYV